MKTLQLLGLTLLWLAFVLWASAAQAQTITATWDPNTGDPYAAGYRLFYGPVSGDYPWSLDAGQQVTATVTVSPGAYFFVVRAYNANYELGPASGEVPITVGSPPPPPPTDSCQADPLLVTVLNWKRNSFQYTASHPIVNVTTTANRGGNILAATFTDSRLCVVVVQK